MKNREKYISSEALILEYLEYDGAAIRWKKRPPGTRVVVGTVAGGPRHAGHMCFKIGGSQLYAHHVIWWLVYGHWAKNEIDHRDGNPGNNTLSNLREATRAQNARNIRPHKKTGRGLKGAYTHSSMNGKWFGQIRMNGKQIHLGRFATEEEAHAAYVKAATILHGEFARTE